jgi:histone H3/H4
MEMSPTFEQLPVVPESTEAMPKPRKLRSSRKKPASVIPRVCFKRLVQDLAKKYSKQNMHWNYEALEVLQEYMEKYMEQYFRMSGNLASLCNKSTVSKEMFEFLEKYHDTLIPC